MWPSESAIMPFRRPTFRRLAAFSRTEARPGGDRRLSLSTKLVTLSLMGGVVAFVVPNIPGTSATTTFGLDQMVSADTSSGSSVTSPAFSTTSANELVVAFVAFDGPNAGSSQSVASVTGGGLSWAQASSSNAQPGTAEVWEAYATSQVSSAQVTATASSAGFGGSITVATFRAAQATVGGVNATSSASGSPSVSLQSTAAGSWIWGVGNDWDNGIARTAASGQTLQHQDVDSTLGNTFWVQSVDTLSSASGQTVAVSDTSPASDRFDMAAVEIVPAQSTSTSNAPMIPGNVSLWPSSATPAIASASDGQPVELGTAFEPLTAGTATGVKFYKGTGNTGKHVGSLWTSSGTLLASGTFTSETASGWQSMTFAKPVALAAGLVYVVAYYAPAGHYSYTSGYFGQSETTPYLYAPASGWNGHSNGVYRYGKGSGFPSSTYGSTNYWVDVSFVPNSVTNAPVATTTTVAPATTTPTTAAPATSSTTVPPTTVAPSTTVPSATSTTLPPTGSGFPDQSNTGYKNAPGYPGSLSNCGGSIVSNTTYSFCYFAGLNIPSTVSNVTFFGDEFASNWVGGPNVFTAGQGITFNYDTFQPSDATAPPITYSQSYQFGIDESGFDTLTINHCEFWGFGEAISMDGSDQSHPLTLENSWIHDPSPDGGGAYHTDGILSNDGGVSYISILHNTIAGVGNTNAVALQTAGGGSNGTPYDHVTVSANYFSGYGAMVNTGGNTNSTNMTFTNNVWGTDFQPGWFPLYGNAMYTTAGLGGKWSGNTIYVKSGTTWMGGGNNNLYWWPTDINPTSSTQIVGHATDWTNP